MGVAYARPSSFGKKVQGSRVRQLQQACAAAALQGSKVHTAYLDFEKCEARKRILEWKLSGLPADKQKTMFLFVESVHALACNSMVSEQIYKKSKENNVTIVPQDFPNLFTHSEAPMGIARAGPGYSCLALGTWTSREEENHVSSYAVSWRDNAKNAPRADRKSSHAVPQSPCRCCV